jgi:hypothetical protein
VDKNCGDPNCTCAGSSGTADIRISSSITWESRSYYPSPGFHFFVWCYAKDTSISEGLDRGAIDEVQFINLFSDNIPASVKLNSNYTGWVLQSGNSPLQNISYLIRTGTWNLTGYFEGNQNYTSSTKTYYFTVLPMERNPTQNIISSISIVKSVFKKIAQVLTPQTIIAKLLKLFKTIPQPLNISPLLTEIEYGIRKLSQSLNILATAKRIAIIIRSSTQPLNILPLLTEMEHRIKTLSQPLNISLTLKRIGILIRSPIQSLNAQVMLTKSIRTFRTISQSFNVQTTIAKLGIFTKKLFQNIIISSESKEIRAPYIHLAISLTTTIIRSISEMRSLFSYISVQPELASSYAHITVTEGPYIPVKCSEWGVLGVHRCKISCPDCYSEINFVVPWVKSVAVSNTGNNIMYSVEVNASIPKSTNSEDDIELYDPNNTLHPFTANIEEGYISWVIPSIEAGETQQWTIRFNTTPPTVSEYNETSGISWTLWHNVSSADIDYERVWDYANLKDPSINVKFYDNTTGSMTEFTGSSSWGPPTVKDLDGNGFSDFAQWMIPKISANIDKKLVIKSTIARVFCEVENKTILNSPVLAWENVEWRWVIKCMNQLDIDLSYSQDLRIPLESSRVYLDGRPIEPGFLTVPPYGPYVTLEGAIKARQNKTHILEFLTPGVTVDIPPASFPSRFWVGEKANLLLDINAKNWASEAINETQTKINIVYGENLRLFQGDMLIDSVDEVRGFYTLRIYNMTPYESRSYMLLYSTPIANAWVERYVRRIENGSQYLIYPFKVTSLASFPVSPLWIRVKHESPFSCSDVYQVWETTPSDYLNPVKPQKVLDFECDGNDTLVELSPILIGETKYYDIFVLEAKKPSFPEITKLLYDFLEGLINLIKTLIQWIISFFGGKT